MSLEQLAFSPEEEVRLREVTASHPNAVEAIRDAVTAVLADAIGPFEGRIMHEIEVDVVLTELIQPIASYLTQNDQDLDLLSLITRDAVLRARDCFVRRLVIAKRN